MNATNTCHALIRVSATLAAIPWKFFGECGMKSVQSMRPMCFNKKNLAAFILALGASGALAPNALAACEAPTKSNFGMNLAVLDATGVVRCDSQKSDTVKKLFDRLETTELQHAHLRQTGYTGVEVASLDIRFNSLPIVLAKGKTNPWFPTMK
jgi:hypothetical protein